MTAQLHTADQTEAEAEAIHQKVVQLYLAPFEQLAAFLEARP